MVQDLQGFGKSAGRGWISGGWGWGGQGQLVYPCGVGWLREWDCGALERGWRWEAGPLC